MTSSGDQPLPYVVIDATVSLKWAFDDGVAVAEAIALRDDALRGAFTMIAPSLWVYDVTNAVRHAVRDAGIPERLGRRAQRELLMVGVYMADPEPTSVLATAETLGLSGYDASYFGLAKALSVPYWTGDRHLFDAVSAQTELLRWIGDYPVGSGSR